MTIRQVRNIIRLNEEETRHANAFQRLSGDRDPNAQKQAVKHLIKSELLNSRIRRIIKECASPVS